MQCSYQACKHIPSGGAGDDGNAATAADNGAGGGNARCGAGVAGDSRGVPHSQAGRSGPSLTFAARTMRRTSQGSPAGALNSQQRAMLERLVDDHHRGMHMNWSTKLVIWNSYVTPGNGGRRYNEKPNGLRHYVTGIVGHSRKQFRAQVRVCCVREPWS